MFRTFSPSILVRSIPIRSIPEIRTEFASVKLRTSAKIFERIETESRREGQIKREGSRAIHSRNRLRARAQTATPAAEPVGFRRQLAAHAEAGKQSAGPPDVRKRNTDGFLALGPGLVNGAPGNPAAGSPRSLPVHQAAPIALLQPREQAAIRTLRVLSARHSLEL